MSIQQVCCYYNSRDTTLVVPLARFLIALPWTHHVPTPGSPCVGLGGEARAPDLRDEGVKQGLGGRGLAGGGALHGEGGARGQGGGARGGVGSAPDALQGVPAAVGVACQCAPQTRTLQQQPERIK